VSALGSPRPWLSKPSERSRFDPAESGESLPIPSLPRALLGPSQQRLQRRSATRSLARGVLIMLRAGALGVSTDPTHGPLAAT
jgi:hypothetical protein